jgi:hypothetical protein
VVDLRGALIGAPAGPGFYPPVPSGTSAPTREFGVDVGGHVYLFQWRAARVGLGADLFWLRGSVSPPSRDDSSTAATGPAEIPDISASLTTVAPQFSLNFGSSAGWSYISAGYGRAQIVGKRSAFEKGDAETRTRGVPSINFGGGARWFTTDHLAVNFDVRFHLVSASDLGRTKLVSVAAGLSFR